MVQKSELIDRGAVNRFLGKANKGFTTSLFYLMKELHLSHNDLLDMPVCSIMILMEELKAHGEREEAEHKKASRKK